MIFTLQPLKAVRILFSQMAVGHVGGQAGKILSQLYLRNFVVQEAHTKVGIFVRGMVVQRQGVTFFLLFDLAKLTLVNLVQAVS